MQQIQVIIMKLKEKKSIYISNKHRNFYNKFSHMLNNDYDF
jgi:hypothetical protein